MQKNDRKKKETDAVSLPMRCCAFVLSCRKDKMSSSNKSPLNTPNRMTQETGPRSEEKRAGEDPSMFEIGTRMGYLEARCEVLEIQNREYAEEIQFLRRQRSELVDQLNRIEANKQTRQERSEDHYKTLNNRVDDLQHDLDCLRQKVELNPAFQMDSEGGFTAFKCLANAVLPIASRDMPYDIAHLENLVSVGHTDPLDYDRRADTLAATQAVYEFEREAKVEQQAEEKEEIPMPPSQELRDSII